MSGMKGWGAKPHFFHEGKRLTSSWNTCGYLLLRGDSIWRPIDLTSYSFCRSLGNADSRKGPRWCLVVSCIFTQPCPDLHSPCDPSKMLQYSLSFIRTLAELVPVLATGVWTIYVFIYVVHTRILMTVLLVCSYPTSSVNSKSYS
jgi:hypothetical protein